MAEKWDSDRELDIELVELVLRAQLPGYSESAIQFLGSGWDFDAYLVNRETVIRFPRRAEVAELLEREEKILSTLKPLVGDVISVPGISFRGTPSSHFPYPFLGHRVIPGVGADHSSVFPSAELAEDIGDALTALHGVKPTKDLEDFFGFETEGIEPRFEETRRLVEEYDDVRSIVPKPCDWLLSAADCPDEFGGIPRFIHNDLCPDHLLVSPKSGRLAGIIDWSDTAFGDAVLDFIFLVLWGGNDFAMWVGKHYQLPLDSGFDVRLDFLARVLSIKWLIEAMRRNVDMQKHIGWVEHAFGD